LYPLAHWSKHVDEEVCPANLGCADARHSIRKARVLILGAMWCQTAKPEDLRHSPFWRKNTVRNLSLSIESNSLFQSTRRNDFAKGAADFDDSHTCFSVCRVRISFSYCVPKDCLWGWGFGSPAETIALPPPPLRSTTGCPDISAVTCHVEPLLLPTVTAVPRRGLLQRTDARFFVLCTGEKDIFIRA
jgi:hypothetical protein